MSGGSASLTVSDAYTRDVGRGAARMDAKSMGEIGASTGDVVEITGRRRTVAKCLPPYPSDEGRGAVRIDGLVRANASVYMGDTVRVRKIRVVDAEGAVVAPLESIPPVDERYLADALDGVPVTKGDRVLVPYFGGRLTFQVVSATPGAGAVMLKSNTAFRIGKAGAKVLDAPMGVMPGGRDAPHSREDAARIADDIARVYAFMSSILGGRSAGESGMAIPGGMIMHGAPPDNALLIAHVAARACRAELAVISDRDLARAAAETPRAGRRAGPGPARPRAEVRPAGRHAGARLTDPAGAFRAAKERPPYVIFVAHLAPGEPGTDASPYESAMMRLGAAASLLRMMRNTSAPVAVVIDAADDPGSVLPGLRESGMFGSEIGVTGGPPVSWEAVLAGEAGDPRGGPAEGKAGARRAGRKKPPASGAGRRRAPPAGTPAGTRRARAARKGARPRPARPRRR